MADRPLHRAPRGVLGLLQQKVLGANPDLFGEMLSPTIDLMDYYGLDLLDVVGPTGTIANPALSTSVSAVVPQGQVWRIKAVALAATVLAADAATTYAGLIALVPPNNALNVAVASSVMVGGSAGVGGRYTVWQPPSPVLLSSGWSIGGVVNSSVAPVVSTAIAMTVMFERIVE